mmetsp:Transcript_23699/g.68120  ORF Transcript_23699/g.68120 Transcript_23699/m.68120 type:complete len:367 (+) Transcript_23699:110-1210(+)
MSPALASLCTRRRARGARRRPPLPSMSHAEVEDRGRIFGAATGRSLVAAQLPGRFALRGGEAPPMPRRFSGLWGARAAVHQASYASLKCSSSCARTCWKELRADPSSSRWPDPITMKSPRTSCRRHTTRAPTVIAATKIKASAALGAIIPGAIKAASELPRASNFSLKVVASAAATTQDPRSPFQTTPLPLLKVPAITSLSVLMTTVPFSNKTMEPTSAPSARTFPRLTTSVRLPAAPDSAQVIPSSSMLACWAGATGSQRSAPPSQTISPLSNIWPELLPGNPLWTCPLGRSSNSASTPLPNTRPSLTVYMLCPGLLAPVNLLPSILARNLPMASMVTQAVWLPSQWISPVCSNWPRNEPPPKPV